MKSIFVNSILILIIYGNIGHTSLLTDIGDAISTIISKAENETSATVTAIANATSTTFESIKDKLSSVLLNSTLESLNLTNLLQNFTINELINASSTTVEEITTSVNSTLQSLNLTSILEKYQSNIPDEGLLDFIGLADVYVGGAEQYYVTTEDGYILELFHIPGNTSKVALFSHGILSSADDFLVRGNTSSIYSFVEKNFDVWAMNYRGNRYSRNHTTLDPDTDALFWKYSMHEMGLYDLAAVIDFVLNQTGQAQLSLIGHSEGTSAVFVLASTKPEYNDKINFFAAMAPVAYLSDTGITLKALLPLGPVVLNVLVALGINELAGFYSTTKKLIDAICTIETIGYDFCYNVAISSLSGFGTDNVDEEFFKYALGHYPAGTCVHNLQHYVQVGLTDEFKMYDYGSTVNTELYGTEAPPFYNLANVTCPVGLYVADNDLVSGLKNAERIKSELPNVPVYYEISYAPFTHQDYIWGENGYEVLFQNMSATIDALYN